LQTRIDTHVRYSERSYDLEADVIAALSLQPGASVLDVGFGTGSFLRRLGDGFALTGVDTSDAAIAAADGFTARWADAQDLPFEDRSFDAVTARHMLYHVPDPMRAISEARRVLRPGGVFAAVVNIEDATPGLIGLVAEAVAAHGIEHSFQVPVHSGNLPGMVTSVFGKADVARHDNALVFTSPEPVVAYAVTCLTAFGVATDDPRRPSIVDTIVTLANEKSVSRDPKGFVVVTARR
jgi:SAM-dependent methyltransferase